MGTQEQREEGESGQGVLGSLAFLPHFPQGLWGTELLVAYPARPHCPSEEAAVLQVVHDGEVGGNIKHQLHVLGVDGKGEVCIDFLGIFDLVQVLRVIMDVAACLVIP